MRYFFAALLALAAAVSAPPEALAADTDQAGAEAYRDGWQAGDDGSTEPGLLGDWVFGEHAGDPSSVGIASSVENGGASTIDARESAFRLLDANDAGHYIDVFKFIEHDLAVGDTLSFDMDVNFRKGFKGIRVRGEDDQEAIFRFEVGDQGEGDDYTVLDAATGNGSVGAAYHDDTQFTVALAQTSPEGGTWRVTRSGGIFDSREGTYTGRVSSFQLYTFQAGSDPNQAIYFNNFRVGP